MGILSWIVFGLIAGALAKWIMPGDDPGGCVITMVIGIVGAVIGGWIATMFGLGGISGFDFRSMLVAVLGAVLLLWVYRVVTR